MQNVDDDGDLDVDDLHGRHMLKPQPLHHVLPGVAAIVPDSLEDVVHLSAHL